jgi:hypothetical protein
LSFYKNKQLLVRKSFRPFYFYNLERRTIKYVE